MASVSDIFLNLHLLLLVGFIGATTVLMLVTVVNRLRIKRVAVVWRQGKWWGLPVWPMAFLLALGVLFSVAPLLGYAVDSALYTGYLMGGVFWLVAAACASSVLVTEFGIILNVNSTERAVAWSQITDYFTFTRGDQEGYVFFYMDLCGTRRRFELTVPTEHRRRLKAILKARLDARFSVGLEELYDRAALEGKEE